MGKWTKDGEVFSGQILYHDGGVTISPSDAQMVDAGWTWVEDPQPSDEDIAEQRRLMRIDELKMLLVESDYKAIKYAEGWLTADEYADTKAQRQAWRDEINELEGANEQ